MFSQPGKILIIAGILLIVAGVLLLALSGKNTFLGRLPGDIYIEKGKFQVYFPITTGILISLIISGLVYIIKRFLL